MFCHPDSLFLRLLPLLFLASVCDADAADYRMDDVPHGQVGVDGGPSMHAGRTHVVDGVTGATRRRTTDDWQRYAFSAGLFADLGFPTSEKGLDGTVGMRLASGISVPGPFFDMNVLARYRLRFVLTGGRSVEPWAGMGIGFHFIDRISSGLFVQLPIAVGCDFQIGGTGLVVTTQIQINTLNPSGPSREGESEGHPVWLMPRYDSYMLRLGLAWQFY